MFSQLTINVITAITISLIAALLISWWLLWQAAEDWEAARRERAASERELRRETERHCVKVRKTA